MYVWGKKFILTLVKELNLKQDIEKTQRDWVEREGGGRIGMGNTCKSMADSCQCMTKPTTIL